MQRYFDKENSRLIYVNREASEDYWDNHWDVAQLRSRITAASSSWVTKITSKFLRAPAAILEGGCGLGSHVYALSKSGYHSFGVDYAPRTVEYLNSQFPELDIRLADVRNLPFKDNTFDGYWSLGVIEHFWNGYEQIASEMSRVITKNGYLFLTYPSMSVLRRGKAHIGCYDVMPACDDEPENFYQFAMASADVVSVFERVGFKLEYKAGLDGLKGIKDEIEVLRPWLQRLYDSQSFQARLVKGVINTALSKTCGHIDLLVFKKV
jgi:SAM-dependent methyltransferase